MRDHAHALVPELLHEDRVAYTGRQQNHVRLGVAEDPLEWAAAQQVAHDHARLHADKDRPHPAEGTRSRMSYTRI